MLQLDEAWLRAHEGALTRIASGTNDVYRLAMGRKRLILKINRQNPEALSPFWRLMRQVFGTDGATQRAGMAALCAAIGQNPYIPPAPLVGRGDAIRALLYADAPGMAYEPDAFPPSDAACFQLGQYIGFLHSQTASDRFGVFPAPTRAPDTFLPRLLAALEALAHTAHWRKDAAVADQLEALQREAWPAPDCALIMPDISANQFLFAADLSRLAAVVDFDAYVVGPKAWELTVLELCLPDGAAFRRGYEVHAPLPSLARERLLYRFAMYLCDPCSPPPLADFLAAPCLFP